MQTVYEAAGGRDGMLRLAQAWHKRVLEDKVVSHAFSHGYHPEHTERLAAYWAEAFGGPTTYSDRYGDETSVVRIHSGNGLHEEMDQPSLACAENQKNQAGIIDVLCGLYLQDRNEIARHFRGDFAAVVSGNFPVHRFGREGLFPKAMLQGLASESGESSFSFSLNYSDDVLRLLWLSQKLANAVGRKPSLTDVIAAVALNQEWMAELSRCGLKPSRELADFDREVRTVVFHATPHTVEGWPREMDFEYDGALQPPFTLEVSTPSGPFQPVHSAKVKLNGSELARVSWPEKPTVSVGVELRSMNKIEFELDGPAFGSVEVTLRGTPA